MATYFSWAFSVSLSIEIVSRRVKQFFKSRFDELLLEHAFDVGLDDSHFNLGRVVVLDFTIFIGEEFTVVLPYVGWYARAFDEEIALSLEHSIKVMHRLTIDICFF